MKRIISVTDAARNFADCINRAHYQNVTFVLLKSGYPVARIVPDNEKVCTGEDLASALAGTKLSSQDAGIWHRELRDARSRLKPLVDKWR